MTAVIAREGSRPRGKRPTRARTETFATHVQLDEILERAAPVASEIGAGDEAGERDGHAGDTRDTNRHDSQDADRGDPRDANRHDSHGADGERDDPTPLRPRASGVPAASDAPIPRPVQPPIQLPGRMPPTGSLLVLAGVGALGLAAASVYVFYQGRGAVLRPDAGRRDAPQSLLEPDAASLPVPVPVTVPVPVPVTVIDAGSPPTDDAEPPADAARPLLPATAVDAHPAELRHDAGTRPLLPDAHEPGELTTRIDAGAARSAGTATLTIGANPWGNVLLDGKKIGRTPIEHLSVPAGHHVVEVIFGGEDPPRSQKFPLDLADGDTRDVLADFTKP